MKSGEVKAFVPPATFGDLITALNKEYSVGWRFVQAMGTPDGKVVFLLDRETDQEVSQADLDAYDKAETEARLRTMFSPDSGPTDPRIITG